MLESVFLKVKPHDSGLSCNIPSQGKGCWGTAGVDGARMGSAEARRKECTHPPPTPAPNVARDQDHVLLSAGFFVYIAETKMLKASCQTIWRGEATVEGWL